MASVSPYPWRRAPNPDGTASVFDANGALVAIVHNGDSELIVEAPAMAALLLQGCTILDRMEASL